MLIRISVHSLHYAFKVVCLCVYDAGKVFWLGCVPRRLPFWTRNVRGIFWVDVHADCCPQILICNKSASTLTYCPDLQSGYSTQWPDITQMCQSRPSRYTDAKIQLLFHFITVSMSVITCVTSFWYALKSRCTLWQHNPYRRSSFFSSGFNCQ